MQLGGVRVGTGTFWVLLVAIGVYVLCGAMRLARFNLMSDKPGSEWFAGIPITAAGGGLISTAIILLARYEDIAFAMPLHAYLPVIMFAFGLAMISTIRFPKIRRRHNKLIDGFQAFNFAASYYFGITRTYPEYLFFMAVFLLIVGIIAGRISKKNESQAAAANAGD
jgi:CDP-diacylglycerol--serine O-phosphatidyltransferase